jgi:hypothetical protein
MLAGFVYQQAIEICLLHVVTTLDLVEWWSIQRTLLSEKTQPGTAILAEQGTTPSSISKLSSGHGMAA